MNPRLMVVVAVLLVAFCGCSNGSSSKQPLSEHQRDSVISRSNLPGSATVGKALEHQDDALQRTASLDSLTQ